MQKLTPSVSPYTESTAGGNYNNWRKKWKILSRKSVVKVGKSEERAGKWGGGINQKTKGFDMSKIQVREIIKIDGYKDMTVHIDGCTIDGVLDLLNRAKTKVKSKYPDAEIRVDIEKWVEYDYPCCEIELYFYREETDAEFSIRINNEQNRQLKIKQREYENYLKLKEKFE